MTPLQDRIFERLTNCFIAGRSVDAHALAADMKRKFPEVEHAGLVETIRAVANGIGVRVQEDPVSVRTTQNSLIARALEIASQYSNNKNIRTRLHREGFSLREIEGHFVGKSFRTQLKKMRSKSPYSSTTVDGDTSVKTGTPAQ